MRLIDADAFKEEIRKDTEPGKIFRKFIDSMPTAYDPDKVVKQLEEIKNRYDNEDFGIKGILCKAIEIVKGGGI